MRSATARQLLICLLLATQWVPACACATLLGGEATAAPAGLVSAATALLPARPACQNESRQPSHPGELCALRGGIGRVAISSPSADQADVLACAGFDAALAMVPSSALPGAPLAARMPPNSPLAALNLPLLI